MKVLLLTGFWVVALALVVMWLILPIIWIGISLDGAPNEYPPRWLPDGFFYVYSEFFRCCFTCPNDSCMTRIGFATLYTLFAVPLWPLVPRVIRRKLPLDWRSFIRFTWWSSVVLTLGALIYHLPLHEVLYASFWRIW